jgi:hypothetical protein
VERLAELRGDSNPHEKQIPHPLTRDRDDTHGLFSENSETFHSRETAVLSHNPVAGWLVLVAEREALSAVTADAEKAWVRKRVEGTQIGRGREIDEGGRSGNDGGADLIDIELRAESRGVAIQEIRFSARPAAGLKSLQERFNCGDGFRGSEGAVAGAIDESLAQQAAVIVHAVHDILVRCFIFDHDQAVALGVQSEDGNVYLAVENNILLQVIDRLWIRLDAGSVI